MSGFKIATSTEHDLLRVPIFDGRAASWHYWSNTFTAALVQKELNEIVEHLDDTKVTPKDNDDCNHEVLDSKGNKTIEEDKELLRLRKQNTRAFAIMLSSMNIKQETGKVA